MILGGLIAFTMMGTVASQVTATATIINMLGNEIGISYEMGALIACVVFIVYTATSGLFGVIYTDVFQFVMLILFVYILIPSASLVKLGGLSAFLEGLLRNWQSPIWMAASWATSLPISSLPWREREMWQRAFAAKSQKAAKEGPVPGDAGLRTYHSTGVVHGRGGPSAGVGGKSWPSTALRTRWSRLWPLRSCRWA